jgi:uncharacterized protein YecE (DUF72 family)
MSGLELGAGTSGFSYDAWKGVFYPEGLSAKKRLGYYASQLTAVEINNTFYRMPKREVLEGWAEQVSDEFSFVLKVTRRITHLKRLKPSSAEELSYVLETAKALGDHLGILLFQLPPNFKQDLERLREFLDLLPEDVRVAFEFRHASWFEDDVFETLRSRNVALVVADTGGENDPPLTATADFGYLRLRREDYTDGELEEWAQRVRTQPWSDAYVFFKHEDAGAGPRMAKRFEEQLATVAAADRSS